MTKQKRQRDPMQVPIGGSDWLFRRGAFNRIGNPVFDYRTMPDEQLNQFFRKVAKSPNPVGTALNLLASDLAKCGTRRSYEDRQYALQREVWQDCCSYLGMADTLKAMQTAPSGVENRRDYRRSVTELFNSMEEMEIKYPFINPKLSEKWACAPIAQYRHRKRGGK